MTIYSASDYAGLEAGKYRFYYGYEQIAFDCSDPNNEQWAFVAWVNGKEKMRVPTTELDSLGNMQGPEMYLLAGIALYLGRK